MMAEFENFFKFPRTKHLFDAGGHGVSRDDLVMSKKESEMFLSGKVFSIEEKVDGANIGISIAKDYKILVQNRSHFVNSSSHKQFGGLDTWINTNSKFIHDILEPERHILFGEWLCAKHSIHYDVLPDYFLAFDIYDKVQNCFLSLPERNEKLKDTGIAVVRTISAEEKRLSKKKLLQFLDSKSVYYDGPVEGLVLKEIGISDCKTSDFFSHRAKIVRPDFLQGIEQQWTRQKFLKNRLTYY